MEQLSGLDATFVHNESARTPMHISPLMIYQQPANKKKAVRFKDILGTFERNLHKSAIFRRKLVQVPMKMDQPYWVEDKNFDLEFHVRHIALPKPGDWRQFCILLARLHARGLDMSRPLWEAYVIEGLDNVEGLPKGAFAILMKVHHSAIDGVSAAGIINALHSLDPVADSIRVDDSWEGEPEPGKFDLLTRAYMNNIRKPLEMTSAIANIVPAFSRLKKLKEELGGEDGNVSIGTRFNGRVSNHRVVDGIAMEFQKIRAIKNAVAGATINDVIVSIVGGGLRRYLTAHDELPDTSLTAAAPISVRSDSDSNSKGNQISVMTISLGTDIADPVERLTAVHSGATRSKAYSSAMGASTMTDVAQSMPARMMALGLKAVSAATMLDNLAVPVHTVVSNVPGPQVPIYMSGARVHTLMGLGPLLDGVGLFHAVISNSDNISIMAASCREMMPDPEFYAQCLQESFDELRDAVL
ncbi:MAG: wax ester/triacylglycerol synthase family O-acyltransferase [Pseudomonadales bacterium]